MDNSVDIRKPVAELIGQHPELKDLLIDLGFTPLANPVLLASLGKVTSLKAGSQFANIPLSKITQTLIYNGYTVLGDEEDAPTH